MIKDKIEITNKKVTMVRLKRCCMCGKEIDAVANYPSLVFCSNHCMIRWLANAKTEDLRILNLPGGNEYQAQLLKEKRFFGTIHYHKEV
jgi:endogenous inhibitor of DNA gyrase (YacG/DUF329 family)